MAGHEPASERPLGSVSRGRPNLPYARTHGGLARDGRLARPALLPERSCHPSAISAPWALCSLLHLISTAESPPRRESPSRAIRTRGVPFAASGAGRTARWADGGPVPVSVRPETAAVNPSDLETNSGRVKPEGPIKGSRPGDLAAREPAVRAPPVVAAIVAPGSVDEALMRMTAFQGRRAPHSARMAERLDEAISACASPVRNRCRRQRGQAGPR